MEKGRQVVTDKNSHLHGHGNGLNYKFENMEEGKKFIRNRNSHLYDNGLNDKFIMNAVQRNKSRAESYCKF